MRLSLSRTNKIGTGDSKLLSEMNGFEEWAPSNRHTHNRGKRLWVGGSEKVNKAKQVQIDLLRRLTRGTEYYLDLNTISLSKLDWGVTSRPPPFAFTSYCSNLILLHPLSSIHPTTRPPAISLGLP